MKTWNAGLAATPAPDGTSLRWFGQTVRKLMGVGTSRHGSMPSSTRETSDDQAANVRLAMEVGTNLLFC